jgi:hypothetical protein
MARRFDARTSRVDFFTLRAVFREIERRAEPRTLLWRLGPLWFHLFFEIDIG